MQWGIDWLPGAGIGPGSASAKASLQPGSRDTEILLVFPGPGSRGAWTSAPANARW
jgi:hypothetical protein